MSHYATRAYANVGVHTAVEAASPHKLVLMLYDGLLKQLRMGKAHMQKKELSPKANCLSKAISILDQGLRISLDLEAGGDIASQLHLLYDYCERRILHANMRNDAAAIDEVISLIEPLRTAWSAIAPESQPRVAQGAGR
jgi:flagellar secretion chaperone FliS